MRKFILLLLLLTAIPFYAQYWIPQTSGVTANLNDVYGISGNEVIIVGGAGTILKTTDGGEHWVQKTSGTVANLQKVQFVNATLGYAVGENGVLLKSTNAGESWVAIDTGFTTNLYGLSCLSENAFYISGENGLIKKTSDGGAHFTDISYAGSYPFSTIQFLNEQVGYACSYHNFGSSDEALIKTIDGGANWTLLSTSINSIYFLNENTGFAKATYGAVLKTTDGGVTLQQIGESLSPNADLFASDANVVWSVENNFTLCDCSFFCIMKRDLTNPETPVEARNCYPDLGNPPFEAITFADATNGYVVGDSGIIYKNSTGNMEDLGLEDLNKNDNYAITPNPASKSVSIINNSNTPINLITISDTNGRKVLEVSNESPTIDINSLTRGIYLVALKTANGSITKKLIKE